MRKSAVVFALLVQVALACSSARAQAEKPAYPAMAPLDQYLIQDENAEIALARSAAPPAIADTAQVMVLTRHGYLTAVKGSNGFLCIVERSWAVATTDPQFWNPEIRSPNCFNSPAARTFAQIYLMKTRLVLAGKSRAAILAAITSEMQSGRLPALAPGAMCYMMSRDQYLNDEGQRWHPHLMFYARGNAAKSWGANLPGSPVLASDDPQEGVTVFLVLVSHWSDGTAAPLTAH